MATLRDYQQEAYDAIRNYMRQGKNPCVVLPCRSGKSYIMKEICDNAYKKGSNTLVLAHRRLLLKQHARLLKTARLESVFTEANHLGEHGKVDLIIIDEAHLSNAMSYQKVCEYYKCPRILFTATAKRLDGTPLNLCDVIYNGISGDELIKREMIAPYELYAPKLNIDLKKVSMSGNDFNNTELGEMMCDKKIYGDIVNNYRRLAGGMQAIAYCVNVKHSLTVCALFNSCGIPAVHIDSGTSEKVRESVMRDFKKGKFKILCNCNLISEGITLPECDCVLLLRPTQSETLYIQQACRCLTPRLGKRAIIIDYVGNVFTHGMPTEKREYTLDATAPRVRNPSREPEVLVRMCKSCLMVYKGTSPICPYCHHDNGKTKKQIEEDKKAELERITEAKRKQARREVGMAQTYEDLVALGERRGYKNPRYWAKIIIESRNNKR